MVLDEQLLARVRGEYSEMPGLRLSQAQACRLWQLDAQTCDALLDTLIAERVLYRLPDGTYVLFSGDGPRRPVRPPLTIERSDARWSNS
jgi:hypothetical protein